jgi:hypothetical protein
MDEQNATMDDGWETWGIIVVGAGLLVGAALAWWLLG